MAEAGKDTVIRPAEAGDAETILRLVRELAAFEGLSEHARARVADLRRDGFGARPLFECLIVERAGAAVGFALFYFTYSTFEGRPGLYVEDLYLAKLFGNYGGFHDRRTGVLHHVAQHDLLKR